MNTQKNIFNPLLWNHRKINKSLHFSRGSICERERVVCELPSTRQIFGENKTELKFNHGMEQIEDEVNSLQPGMMMKMKKGLKAGK